LANDPGCICGCAFEVAAELYPLWSLASFLIFTDHRATDFTLSKTFETVQSKLRSEIVVSLFCKFLS
jgi:hypothetical protein